MSATVAHVAPSVKPVDADDCAIGQGRIRPEVTAGRSPRVEVVVIKYVRAETMFGKARGAAPVVLADRIEIGAGQAEAVLELFGAAGLAVDGDSLRLDLAGRLRSILARSPR